MKGADVDDMHESWDGGVRVERGLMTGLLVGVAAMVVGLGLAARAIWMYALPLLAVLAVLGVVVAISRTRELRELDTWAARAEAMADHPAGTGHTRTRMRVRRAA